MSTQTAERPATLVETPSPPKGNVVPYRADPAPKAYPQKIAQALLAIKREIGAIEKTGWNDFHKYHYQKWEDVLDRLSMLEARHGLIIQQSEVSRSLFNSEAMISITYCFTIINGDGDAWPDRPEWTAIARARDSKGILDDKAANKCHTQAHKYFLLHTFKIKTKEAAEDDSDGDAPKQVAAPKPPKPGSPEAQALEAPRAIVADDAATWVERFIAAIKDAPPKQLAEWRRLNEKVIERLKTGYADLHTKVEDAIKARTPAPPKPPRPAGAMQVAVATSAVPNPAEDGPGWLKWLAERMAKFESYADGEKYWNDHVDPMELPRSVEEEKMGVWSDFEKRFEP